MSIKVFCQFVVDALCVIHQVLCPIMGFSCQLVLTDKVDLPVHILPYPISFVGMQEVDTQSRYNLPAVALFLPVEYERIKIVLSEIHHGVDLVLYTFAHPSLRILIYGMESIPAT